MSRYVCSQLAFAALPLFVTVSTTYGAIPTCTVRPELNASSNGEQNKTSVHGCYSVTDWLSIWRIFFVHIVNLLSCAFFVQCIVFSILFTLLCCIFIFI